MSNQQSIKAGVLLDVLCIKRKIKSFFEYKEVSLKPKMHGGEVAVAAVLQYLIEKMCEDSAKNTLADTAGFKNIQKDTLKNVILVDPDYRSYMCIKFERYDENQLYMEQLPLTGAIFEKIIDKTGLPIRITNKAKNMMCFILVNVYLDICEKSFLLLEFSGKKMFSHECVVTAIQMIFQPTLADDLKCEIVRTIDNACDGKETAEDAENDDTVAPKNRTRQVKTPISKATKEVEEPVEEAEEHAEEAEEHAEEAEEQEQEAEPVPTKPAARGTKKDVKTESAQKKPDPTAQKKPDPKPRAGTPNKSTPQAAQSTVKPVPTKPAAKPNKK